MTIHHSRGASLFVSSVLVVSICMAIVCTPAARASEPDIPKIQTGAERGSIAEEIALGAAYMAGKGVPRDEKRAAYWYEKAANSGDPGAQLEIGYFYQAGIGVDRNPVRAAQWFQRSASSGMTAAKVNLGVAYVWGLGVRKDPEFAAQLFREAAKKGDGSGACYLGDLYFFGIGVPQDTSEAKHWFEMGSKLHNPMAKFDLALILLNEKDHSRDEEVMKLLRASAQAGYVRAKHQLGLMLVRNPSLEGAPGEAVATLEEASGNGFWKSSLILGVLARDGRSGVPQDSKSAYYHFQIAALQGGDIASSMLARDLHLLKSTLTHDEKEALDSEAAVWVSEHARPVEFTTIQVKDPKSYPALALQPPNQDTHAGMLFNELISDPLPARGNTLRPRRQ
jgi:uncharacterized protein